MARTVSEPPHRTALAAEEPLYGAAERIFGGLEFAPELLFDVIYL